MTTQYISTSNPKIWGDVTWKFLHISAEHYPLIADLTRQTACRQFLNSLGIMLPCKECRDHYNDFLAKHTETLNNAPKGREQLVHFFLLLHNDVNQRLGKKILPETLETRLAYQHHKVEPPCGSKWPWLFYGILLALLCILLMKFLCNRCAKHAGRASVFR